MFEIFGESAEKYGAPEIGRKKCLQFCKRRIGNGLGGGGKGRRLTVSGVGKLTFVENGMHEQGWVTKCADRVPGRFYLSDSRICVNICTDWFASGG